MRPASVVVLNLARRADRLERFRARWAVAGLPDVELVILAASDEHERGAPPTWPRGLARGAWGCWDSHIRALQRAATPALILEDDAVFDPRFASVLGDLVPPPDWDVVHLGGQHLYSPIPVVPGLVAPRRGLHRSHAYLARRPQTLAAQLRRTPDHVDRALGRLNLRRYCVDPWLVGQDSSRSDITRSDTPTVDFWQEVRRGA